MRSNQLSYPAMTVVKIVVEIEGLEPSLTEPESVVLPLHHISIWLPIWILGLQRYECFAKMQNFFEKYLQMCLLTMWLRAQISLSMLRLLHPDTVCIEYSIEMVCLVLEYDGSKA